MTIDSTAASLGIPLGTPAKTDDPKKIHDSAQQFESLLIAEMLKASHGSDDGGWLGTGDDDAGSTGVEMAEQQLAQAVASKGGFGLARLIEQGLTQQAKLAPDPAPGPAGTAAGSAE